MKNQYNSNNKKLNTSKNSSDSDNNCSIQSVENSRINYQSNSFNTTFSNSFIDCSNQIDMQSRIKGYFKAKFNKEKHGYEVNHFKINDDESISDNLKLDYNNYYSNRQNDLNKLRQEKKIKNLLTGNCNLLFLAVLMMKKKIRAIF